MGLAHTSITRPYIGHKNVKYSMKGKKQKSSLNTKNKIMTL